MAENFFTIEIEIELVVGFPPGGGNDTVARLFDEKPQGGQRRVNALPVAPDLFADYLRNRLC